MQYALLYRTNLFMPTIGWLPQMGFTFEIAKLNPDKDEMLDCIKAFTVKLMSLFYS